MPSDEVLTEIYNAIIDFDSDRARHTAEKAAQSGMSAYKVVMDGLSPALEEIGKKYESGEYFLSELLLAADTAKSVLDALKPHFQAESRRKPGRVLIGTVEGDLHDIGKNLFSTLAAASGYEVIDLGTDVSPRTFAQKTLQAKPDVVAMSSLLSTTVPKFRETVEELRKQGVRERVEIIIGGAAATQQIANEYGIEGYERDAVAGVKRVTKWLR
jgi:5-methyltetrahydrofolate--homocysteine methyltransferase